jgi:hypothetical protein
MPKPPKRPKIGKMWRGVKAAPPPDPTKEMMREHEDVLQNIEFTLVRAWRDRPEVDDKAALDALSAALRREEPGAEPCRLLFDQLRAARETRPDVADETWAKGLRVVAESVRRHSDLRPGSTGYLDFVAPFLP